MKKILHFFVLYFLLSNLLYCKDIITSFQTSSSYNPLYDIKTDAVFISDATEDKIKSWKNAGYTVYAMFGFRENKKYARKYPGEVQTTKEGYPLFTVDTQMYYIVPTQERRKKFVDYTVQLVKMGVEGISPEEPEFFTRAGHEPAFKKEWEKYYGEEWKPPHTNVNTRYKSEMLKGKLWFRQIEEIFSATKKENQNTKCFLMIHSPINYAVWGYPFLYSKTIKLETIDEIVSQVWTGTAKTPIKSKGEMRELIFENAFCEYSSMFNLVRGTKIPLWFLLDPVEDTPGFSEEFYENGYEDVITSSLFYPDVVRYEVMPWPERIFGEENRFKLSDDYKTKIIVISNILREMKDQKEIKFQSGEKRIGVLISETLSFQREEPSPSSMDTYYGLTIPLIRKGIPIQTLLLERIEDEGYLSQFKVLFLSYDGFKPLKSTYHDALIRWIRKGGMLIFFGKGDAYNDVLEWWRKDGFLSPSEHLFQKLDFSPELVKKVNFGEVNVQIKKINKGYFVYTQTPSSFFCESKENEEVIFKLLKYLFEKKLNLKLKTSENFILQRGKFVIARSFDRPTKLKGHFVDIFDRDLKVVKDKNIPENSNAFLIDIGKIDRSIPRLIISAGRVENIIEKSKETSFYVEGPLNVKNKTRLWCGKYKPEKISVVNKNGESMNFDFIDDGNSLLLKFDNLPGGVRVKISWKMQK